MDSLIVFFAAFLGGLIQTTTGFGGSLIVMMFFPLVMSLTEATTLNLIILLVLDTYLVIANWKFICFRLVIVPSVISICITTIFIQLSMVMNIQTMKLIFGVFLIGISIYFWMFSDRMKIKPNLKSASICAGLSGITNGLFGIGGPPIALYYLSTTQSKEQYIATTQFFFLITTTYTVCVRLMNGMISTLFWTYFAVGAIAILIGKAIGSAIYHYLSQAVIKKCVYIYLMITGVYTVWQCL